MKVTFPHMGHLWLVLKAALTGIGLEVVVPPPVPVAPWNWECAMPRNRPVCP